MRILSLLLFVFLMLSKQSFAAIPSPTPCRNPFESAPPPCVAIENHHRCDDGSLSGFASAVMPSASPNDAVRFNNMVNKKLACCMNEFTSNPPPGDAYSKFDCVDNGGTQYKNFNELWSSYLNEDQDLMNALYLVNSTGKPLTGFYTLAGARCDDLSEFAAPLTGIQPYLLDPKLKTGQQQGTAYPIPNVKSFADLQVKLNKKFPDPNLDPTTALRCPILVRAAMVAYCPNNPALPIAQMSYAFPPNGKLRCSVAKAIQIHVQIEQLYEITGSPKMQTIDTVIDPSLTRPIPIDRIISMKNGNACTAETVSWNSLCAYPNPNPSPTP